MRGARECPKCERICTPGAGTCDCGYEFDAARDTDVNKQAATDLRNFGPALLLLAGLLLTVFYLPGSLEDAGTRRLVLKVVLLLAAWGMLLLLRAWRRWKKPF